MIVFNEWKGLENLLNDRGHCFLFVQRKVFFLMAVLIDELLS